MGRLGMLSTRKVAEPKRSNHLRVPACCVLCVVKELMRGVRKTQREILPFASLTKMQAVGLIRRQKGARDWLVCGEADTGTPSKALDT